MSSDRRYFRPQPAAKARPQSASAVVPPDRVRFQSGVGVEVARQRPRTAARHTRTRSQYLGQGGNRPSTSRVSRTSAIGQSPAVSLYRLDFTKTPEALAQQQAHEAFMHQQNARRQNARRLLRRWRARQNAQRNGLSAGGMAPVHGSRHTRRVARKSKHVGRTPRKRLRKRPKKKNAAAPMTGGDGSIDGAVASFVGMGPGGPVERVVVDTHNAPQDAHVNDVHALDDDHKLGGEFEAKEERPSNARHSASTTRVVDLEWQTEEAKRATAQGFTGHLAYRDGHLVTISAQPPHPAHAGASVLSSRPPVAASPRFVRGMRQSLNMSGQRVNQMLGVATPTAVSRHERRVSAPPLSLASPTAGDWAVVVGSPAITTTPTAALSGYGGTPRAVRGLSAVDLGAVVASVEGPVRQQSQDFGAAEGTEPDVPARGDSSGESSECRGFTDSGDDGEDASGLAVPLSDLEQCVDASGLKSMVEVVLPRTTVQSSSIDHADREAVSENVVSSAGIDNSPNESELTTPQATEPQTETPTRAADSGSALRPLQASRSMDEALRSRNLPPNNPSAMPRPPQIPATPSEPLSLGQARLKHSASFRSDWLQFNEHNSMSRIKARVSSNNSSTPRYLHRRSLTPSSRDHKHHSGHEILLKGKAVTDASERGALMVPARESDGSGYIRLVLSGESQGSYPPRFPDGADKPLRGAPSTSSLSSSSQTAMHPPVMVQLPSPVELPRFFHQNLHAALTPPPGCTRNPLTVPTRTQTSQHAASQKEVGRVGAAAHKGSVARSASFHGTTVAQPNTSRRTPVSLSTAPSPAPANIEQCQSMSVLLQHISFRPPGTESLSASASSIVPPVELRARHQRVKTQVMNTEGRRAIRYLAPTQAMPANSRTIYDLQRIASQIHREQESQHQQSLRQQRSMAPADTETAPTGVSLLSRFAEPVVEPEEDSESADEILHGAQPALNVDPSTLQTRPLPPAELAGPAPIFPVRLRGPRIPASELPVWVDVELKEVRVGPDGDLHRVAPTAAAETHDSASLDDLLDSSAALDHVVVEEPAPTPLQATESPEADDVLPDHAESPAAVSTPPDHEVEEADQADKEDEHPSEDDLTASEDLGQGTLDASTTANGENSGGGRVPSDGADLVAVGLDHVITAPNQGTGMVQETRQPELDPQMLSQGYDIAYQYYSDSYGRAVQMRIAELKRKHAPHVVVHTDSSVKLDTAQQTGRKLASASSTQGRRGRPRSAHVRGRTPALVEGVVGTSVMDKPLPFGLTPKQFLERFPAPSGTLPPAPMRESVSETGNGDSIVTQPSSTGQTERTRPLKGSKSLSALHWSPLKPQYWNRKDRVRGLPFDPRVTRLRGAWVPSPLVKPPHKKA